MYFSNENPKVWFNWFPELHRFLAGELNINKLQFYYNQETKHRFESYFKNYKTDVGEMIPHLLRDYTNYAYVVFRKSHAKSQRKLGGVNEFYQEFVLCKNLDNRFLIDLNDLKWFFKNMYKISGHNLIFDNREFLHLRCDCENNISEFSPRSDVLIYDSLNYKTIHSIYSDLNDRCFVKDFDLKYYVSRIRDNRKAEEMVNLIYATDL